MWEGYSDEYQERHGHQLADSGGAAWGTYQYPEAELQVLGDVAGKDVLEFGCGAAQWSIALAQRGARMVGLDFSARQLEHARRLMAEAGVDFPLVEAQRRGRAAPRRLVRHRLLRPRGDDLRRPVPDRPGGRPAAATRRAVRVQPRTRRSRRIAWAPDAEHAGDRLVLDYFGMHRLDDDDDDLVPAAVRRMDPAVPRQRLRDRGPDRAAARPDATSTYRDAESMAWARRWPSECIWRLRRT